MLSDNGEKKTVPCLVCLFVCLLQNVFAVTIYCLSSSLTSDIHLISHIDRAHKVDKENLQRPGK